MEELDNKKYKVILEELKQVFAVISGRSCPHLVIKGNDAFVTNLNPNTAGVFGYRVTDYRIGDLVIHLIKFKNPATLNFIKNLLSLKESTDDTLICVNILTLLSVLGKRGMDDLKPYSTDEGTFILDDKDQPSLVAYDVTEWHIVRNLNAFEEYMGLIGTEEHYRNNSVQVIGQPALIFLSEAKKEFFVPVYKRNFLYNGKQEFPDDDSMARFYCKDGKAVLSLTFLKKHKGDFKIYAWIEHAVCVLASVYDDESYRIVTFRPNANAVFLRNTNREFIRKEEITNESI